MSPLRLPRYIGICGRPSAGKSEIQRILAELYGVVPVDDGLPLRLAATAMTDLPFDKFSTQEGKASFMPAEIILKGGNPVTSREFLGDLGLFLEQNYGSQTLAKLALKTTERQPDVPAFSFGSVRRDQGHVYKRAGGIVIEVERPGVPESPHEFDRYDRSCIDFTIINDGTISSLECKLFTFMTAYTQSAAS